MNMFSKRIETYFIKNLAPNFTELLATNPAALHKSPYGAGSGQMLNTNNSSASGSYLTGAIDGVNQGIPVDAEHVVHVSLTEGMDHAWPFGISILEPIFKVFKQKELLEDSIIIYRVHRAPERRVFQIDVGNMPTHLAMGFVERVKNEIHQRRIPSIHGGQSVVDATYNPLSMNEDYFFPVTAEGRGSKVDTLPGGTNLGEIDDLRFFTNKLFRGLRIPSSYLPTGAEDGQQQYNDGRVGTAYIQELRFNKYCARLQSMLAETFDSEFKLWIKSKGYKLIKSYS